MIDTAPIVPVPVRAARTDEPEQVLRFAEEWFRQGPVALETLVEIRSGAAKPLGSQMAVAADGRFCGYVSGGCIEAAVASEALAAIVQGQDRMATFGDGSPSFDIVLPCGGGITIAIHLVRNIEAVRDVIAHLARRQQVALRYCPAKQTLERVEAGRRSQWLDGSFFSVSRPRTRVVVSGQSLESDTVSSLAEASGYEVLPLFRQTDIASLIDTFTGVVLLHHDFDLEARVLDAALRSPAFYLGALGSTRIHRRRTERLLKEGYMQPDVDRINAPIGLFGPARDATSLALSVVADVAAARLAAFA